MYFTHWYNFHVHSLSGCPLNAQAIKKGKVSEELMTIKLKATGGKSTELKAAVPAKVSAGSPKCSCAKGSSKWEVRF